MPHRFGINLAPNSTDKKCDALIIVSYDDKLTFTRELEQYRKLIDEQKEFDIKYQIEGGMIVLPSSSFKRLIYTPVGPINRDFDDVRTFMDAATRGLSRALKAGARMPLIILPSINGFHEQYSLFDLSILLGVYQILYVPLENREYKSLTKVDFIDFTNFCDVNRETKIMELAKAIECGRGVARDIGGSDPERMSAPNTAKYVEALFENSSVKVEVISDLKIIEKEFPCLAAVNRASVDRHAARVIFLSYEPEETPEKTIFLVGKGVTYDTGGCDIKSGGVMAGMHRDKCGAAAVAGFLET
ncbi:aminopeptidase-like protein, partial [Euroglyphus maynei]